MMSVAQFGRTLSEVPASLSCSARSPIHRLPWELLFFCAFIVLTLLVS